MRPDGGFVEQRENASVVFDEVRAPLGSGVYSVVKVSAPSPGSAGNGPLLRLGGAVLRLAVGAGLLALMVAGCSATLPSSQPATNTPVSQTAGAAPISAPVPTTPPITVDCDYVVDGPGVNPSTGKRLDPPSGTDVQASGTVEYVMMLGKTPIKLILDRAKAPCAVHSFEWLASEGYYEGTLCERSMMSGVSSVECSTYSDESTFSD